MEGSTGSGGPSGIERLDEWDYTVVLLEVWKYYLRRGGVETNPFSLSLVRFMNR